MRHAAPASLSQALALMAEGGWQPLAGGTDLYPATDAPDLAGDILDLGSVPGLAGLSIDDGHLRIGAATTWATLAEAPLPPACTALQQAARQVGGRQIQNMGTIGGNLCNASPAADGIPPLLALDALVELASASGTRRVPISDFVIGPRRTARKAAELVTALLLPPAALTGRSSFLKLGARAHLVISIVMVAARVDLDADGHVAKAALAIGACAPSARRLGVLERSITGLSPDAAIARITPAALAASLAPIDDIRGTAEYRLAAATELARRAVQGCLA